MKKLLFILLLLIGFAFLPFPTHADTNICPVTGWGPGNCGDNGYKDPGTICVYMGLGGTNSCRDTSNQCPPANPNAPYGYRNTGVGCRDGGLGIVPNTTRCCVPLSPSPQPYTYPPCSSVHGICINSINPQVDCNNIGDTASPFSCSSQISSQGTCCLPKCDSQAIGGTCINADRDSCENYNLVENSAFACSSSSGTTTCCTTTSFLTGQNTKFQCAIDGGAKGQKGGGNTYCQIDTTGKCITKDSKGNSTYPYSCAADEICSNSAISDTGQPCAQNLAATIAPQYFPCSQGLDKDGKTTKDVTKIVKCTVFNSALGSINLLPADFIAKLIAIVLSISGGIVLLLVITAGYQMAWSQGNPEKVKESREKLVAALIGLIFIIFAGVILQIVGVNILGLSGFAQ